MNNQHTTLSVVSNNLREGYLIDRGKVFLLLLAAVLLAACSSAATTAPVAKAPPTAPELPKCLITWAEARLGDAQAGSQLAAWKATQKQTEQAAAAIANRFTTLATLGDSVYVVSADGVMIQAVGIDETMLARRPWQRRRGYGLATP